MKRTSLFRKFFSVVFAAAVVFTVSVHEVHFLFSHHEEPEHCENHLHSADHHSDCAVCKFDVSFFTDYVFSSDNSNAVFIQEGKIAHEQSFNLQSSIFNLSLRGPPSFA